MTIKIVTDSTSDLPPEILESLDVKVVPLNVHFDAEVFKDGVTLGADEFFDRLINGNVIPKTSQPSIGEFAEAFKEVAPEADGIVSIHISSKVSGTYNAAVQGKEEAGVSCPIEVIDTYQASMGIGVVVIKAAKAAQAGASFEEVAEIAKSASGQCQCFVLLDTLEYLQKGGRIGKAKAIIGSLLRVRPMIIVRDGEAHELGKERTRNKGLARLIRTAREFAPIEELSVIYSTDPDDAHSVANDLRDLLPDGKEPIITRFGPVLGTYVGPKAVGIGLLRADSD